MGRTGTLQNLTTFHIWNIIILVIFITTIVGCSSEDTRRIHFDKLYTKWLNESEVHTLSLRSDIHPKNDNPSYREMMSLGREYTPYLIDKMRSDPQGTSSLWPIVNQWSKKHFLPHSEYLKRVPLPDEIVYLFVNWWDFGRDSTKVQFERYYKLLLEDAAQGKIGYYNSLGQTHFGHARLRWLGVDALPLLIEMVEKGDTLVIQVISEIIYGGSPNSPRTEFQSSKELLNWWAENKNEWTLPSR